jgi:hypothetical protein
MVALGVCLSSIANTKRMDMPVTYANKNQNNGVVGTS